MYIRKLFNDFCTQNLNEPSNKNNKNNYNLCQETYSKTQLLDLSGVGIAGTIITMSRISKDDNKIKLHISEETLNLPFDACFFKIEETEECDFCLFIREYQPMVFTGCCYIDFKNFSVLKMPFIIRTGVWVGDSNVEITVPEGVLPMSSTTVIYKFCDALAKINTLNTRDQALYITEKTSTHYFRRKGQSTLKAVKPIYIYCQKSKTQYVYKHYEKFNIERLNSWLVRGHWRRLDNPKKIGKNASGEYNVEGFTWVIPHKCGKDEEKILQREYIAIK